MSKIINSNTGDFENNVIRSDIPVLVDFWAPWCGPCIRMSPILEEISDELNGKIKIVKVDVDENFDLAQKFDIRGIPNMKLFKNGTVVKEMLGMRPKDILLAEVNEFL